VVDYQFAEPSLAALYDLFCPWDPQGDSGFYLPLVMAANSVLDVGCGTGALLRRAKAEGHTGRLCGLDPAAAMLAVARAEGGVDWVVGDLSTARWQGEFDLITMTGHAFQVLTGDEQLRVALAAVRTALAPGGRFAFETRNPLVRGWERWVPEHAQEITDSAGVVVAMALQVELPVQGDLVSFTATYSSSSWERPRVSRSTLRFLDVGALSRFLVGASLAIEDQYGDWDRSALGPASPEIITICRASGECVPSRAAAH
jgi:SAM-dependent methyltransferase